MYGLRTAYALALASGGTAFLLGFAAEWKKVNVQAIGNEPQSADKGLGRDESKDSEAAGAFNNADSSS